MYFRCSINDNPPTPTQKNKTAGRVLVSAFIHLYFAERNTNEVGLESGLKTKKKDKRKPFPLVPTFHWEK